MSFRNWLKQFVPMSSRSLNSRIDNIDNRITVLQNKISSLERTTAQIRRISRENNWTDVYNSTIEGTNWLKSRRFSPGRWAIGYQYLYVLYRILDEVHPKNIIDLGLGQSSWMIAQYAASDEEVSHTIVEHDQTWIDGFLKDHALPENSKIMRLNLGTKQYQEAVVRVYDGFAEIFSDRKFDLISIDGPFGGDMPDYARIDVLGMLPGILSENFIILIDDTERSGEKHTVREMERILTENEIKFAKEIYSGAKDMTIICAEDLHFLTTM